MSRSKYYCFTFNNYNDGDLAVLQFRLQEAATYYTIGREVAESGTRHLQGYIELSTRTRLNKVKSLLGFNGIHFECRRGSATEASEYCKKDGDYVEFGTLSKPESGRRKDLDELHESLKQKRSLRDISDEHFGSFLKYRRSIYAYRSLHQVQRNWKCSVIVYWGPTGTGKTRAVYDNSTDLWEYPGEGWFDGYDGQNQVLFDEFSGSSFKLPYLLKLLDRYPLQVPIKGDFVSWIPHEIYITSNINPRNWFSNAHTEHVAALFRRFTNVFQFE